MGLLDAFLKGTGDPEKDAAINQGLLNAGLALMQARGKLFPALGQAGQVGLQSANQYTQQQQAQRRAGLQDRMLQGQLAQQQRQQEIQGLAQKAYVQPSQPGIDATGGMETALEAPNNQASQYGRFDQEKYLSSLQAYDPVESAKQRAMFNPTPEAYTLPKDAVRFVGGRVVASNVQPEKVDPNKPFMIVDGKVTPNPEYQTYAMRLAEKGSTKVRVDAGQRQENAFTTKQGGEFSDMMGGINKQSFAAPAQIRKLERMTQLLDGVDGGKLAPVGLEIASAANAIGIKMDPKLGNKEAAQALAREIAGGFRQPGTGPMTDKDFENFLLQVPDLSKSAEGRKQITATMKAALNRDVALGKLAREYVSKNGQLDNGFLDEASTFIAENPVVGAPAGWKVQR